MDDSSMFLTLIVVPVIYYLMDRVLAKFGLNKEVVIELVDTPIEELNTEISETLAKVKHYVNNTEASSSV